MKAPCLGDLVLLLDHMYSLHGVPREGSASRRRSVLQWQYLRRCRLVFGDGKVGKESSVGTNGSNRLAGDIWSVNLARMMFDKFHYDGQ